MTTAESAPPPAPTLAQAVFTAANDAIFVIDPAQDRIIDANPKACNLLGYSHAELLNLPVSAIHPQEMIELLRFARKVMDAGSGWTDRLSCTKKTGQRLPAYFSASTTDIDGTACLVVLIRPFQPYQHDVLEELVNQTAALTGDAFFHSLMRHLTTTLGVRHALIATLPQYDGLAEPVGWWWNGTEVAAFKPRFPGTPSARVVTGEVVHYPDNLPELYPELRHRAPGVVSYLGFPLRAAKGEIIGVIAVFDDKPMPAIPLEMSIFRLFAERAQAELERRRMGQALLLEKQAAEIANRAKTDFLANLSHELRTPLNGVLGYTQFLNKATNLTPTQRNAVRIMQRSGEYLLNLINDLLDLSKIEAQHIDTHISRFRLDEFLQLLVEMVSERAQSKGLALIFAPDPALPTLVRGDEKRLRQILINLLGNAIKFTDKGQIHFRIEYAAEQARFTVSDSGIGIPEAQLEAIFQPFERVSDAARWREGSGLGLTICRRLSAALNGTLDVSSQVGVGSTFTFSLPLPVADHCDTVLAPAQPQPLTPPSLQPDFTAIPSLTELETLAELASLGDIRSVVDRAEQIETHDSAYRPFADKLRQLARSFQINELRDFLRALIKR